MPPGTNCSAGLKSESRVASATDNPRTYYYSIRIRANVEGCGVAWIAVLLDGKISDSIIIQIEVVRTVGRDGDLRGSEDDFRIRELCQSKQANSGGAGCRCVNI